MFGMVGDHSPVERTIELVGTSQQTEIVHSPNYALCSLALHETVRISWAWLDAAKRRIERAACVVMRRPEERLPKRIVVVTSFSFFCDLEGEVLSSSSVCNN